jgi:hypothetical protein
VSRPILWLGAHVEHDHLAPRQPFLELGGGDLLHPVSLAQILLGEHAHLGDVTDGDVADGSPEITHPLACEPGSAASLDESLIVARTCS